MFVCMMADQQEARRLGRLAHRQRPPCYARGRKGTRGEKGCVLPAARPVGENQAVWAPSMDSAVPNDFMLIQETTLN